MKAETLAEMGDIVVASLGGGIGDMQRDAYIGAEEQHLEVIAEAEARA